MCSALLWCAGGCGGGGGGEAGTASASTGVTLSGSPTGDPTTTAAATGSTAEDSGTGSAASTAQDPTTGAKFDLAVDDLPFNVCMPGDPDCGCSAVDVLFVVDNSGSMQEHAPGVIAAFDPFVEEMVGVLPAGTSLHVGVTRATGFYDPGNIGGWSGPSCQGQTDGAWNPPTTANNGVNGQQGRLYEQDGQRYFAFDTDGDPQALKNWFQAALTGAIDLSAPHSNTETVVAASAYPFHPANADHNAGFMRQQAVLVLFLLSDSPDLSPARVPTSDFIAMVSDAKAACGDMCIITTGAIASACYDQPGNVNTRLFDFMNGFGQPPPSWTPLQAQQVADFEGVLGAALTDLIGATCQAIPPG